MSGRSERSIDIFVDESGRMAYPDTVSRFYIVGLVLHDTADDLSRFVGNLAAVESEIGLEDHCFHMGPLLRKEKGYAFMNRRFRGRILSRMMAFAEQVDFKYHCLVVDKKYVDSVDQIVERLSRQLSRFLSEWTNWFALTEKISIYYDCGQAPITNLLHATFERELGRDKVTFAQGVRPERYRLFQIADLVCSVSLIEQRINAGMGLTHSEQRFFGGPRDFKRNILKKLMSKKL